MARRVHAPALRTKRAAVLELLRHGSPYVLVTMIVLAVAVRASAGGAPGVTDLVMVSLVVSLQPFVELGLHRGLLHLRPRRLGRWRLDPGASHRGHHRVPDDVHGALLGTPYAIADSLAIVAVIVLAGALAAPIASGYPAAAVATAAAAGCAGLLWYEWVHLLLHTGYRPRSAWFRRLRANHLRHHHRDEERWFGITTTFVDRLTGTGGGRQRVDAESAW